MNGVGRGVLLCHLTKYLLVVLGCQATYQILWKERWAEYIVCKLRWVTETDSKKKVEFGEQFMNSIIKNQIFSTLKIVLRQTVLLQSSVQFSPMLSRVRLFATPWIAARQASLSITNSRSSLKLTSIELVMPSGHLILCRPLLLLPPIPPSIRVFSNESTLPMRWPKYWSLSFSIIPSKEHPGLISFRMDWLDLLAVQGTLKSLLQHHSSKASILRRSALQS